MEAGRSDARSGDWRTGDWLGPDVVETSPADDGWLGRRWRGLPPSRRRAAVLALVATVCIAAAAAGVVAGRSWLEERALADEVTLSVSLGVSSSSTTPAGGSVDFYVSVVNTGPRAVTITAVDITTARFRITNGEIRLPRVEPANSLLVPLSVILTCTGPDENVGPDLPGVVGAVPASGRARDVEVRVGDAEVVTGVADTLCRLRPDLADLELDGPVL